MWKVIALCSAGLIILGLGAIALDLTIPSQLNTLLLVRHIPLVFLTVLIGVIGFSIGMIGWTALIDGSRRTNLASFALVFPISVILIGYLLARGDMHGTFPLFLLPMAPLIVIDLVLWIMAAFAQKTST